jgi:F-type H+-transporting ATPase subunit delta
MSDIRVAGRYAKSLYDLALSQGSVETIKGDIDNIRATLVANHELVNLLASPIVRHGKKLSVLTELFKGKVNDTTLAFFALLAEKGRVNSLIHIADEFLRMYNEANGIALAEVTTAFAIDDSLRASLRGLAEKETGKRVILTEKVDARIVGGYLLNIGDRQIDQTLSSQIEELKLKLIDQSYKRKF